MGVLRWLVKTSNTQKWSNSRFHDIKDWDTYFVQRTYILCLIMAGSLFFFLIYFKKPKDKSW